jgi:hypothetical protein
VRVSSAQHDPETTRRSRLFSGLLVAFVLLILLRAVPLAQDYAAKLLGKHRLSILAAGSLGAAAGFLLLVVAISRWPRLTVQILGAVALLLIFLSGNFTATLVAGAILALTLLAGDALSRVLRGREAAEGDLACVFAAGVVTAGLIPLFFGDAGLFKPAGVCAAALALLLLRWRRIRELTRLIRRSIRLPQGDSPPLLEALWIAAAIILIGAEWIGSLGPDFSWDALAYHLPEALQIARNGRVDYLIDLAPQTYFWHNHETFLSIGFLFDGERAARVLHFAAGLGVFAAALALGRRLGAGGSNPLLLLALAAFPTADLQLHATYVDWPAAFLLTAAAAEIAAAGEEKGRLRLAGFLFGGAIATKVFVILAAPALALLLARRGGWAWRRIVAACFGTLLALLPWLAWSQSRAGFFLAPYTRSISPVAVEPAEPTVREATASVPVRHVTSLSGFLELPYDLTFHSSRFEGNGNGYNGVTALAILPGILGWGAWGFLYYLVAALAALVPWYLLYDPSVRYVIPVYPLYALFAVEGLRRLTRDFAGRTGRLAGGALALAALAFPVQFGSSFFEWKVAVGALSWERALEERLPEYPLFRHLRPADRVVFLGEHDRFHCPARIAYRSEWYPVNRWGNDPALWRQKLTRYRITHLLVRDEAWDRVPLVRSLRDRLELVDRQGVAALYRVLPEPETASRAFGAGGRYATGAERVKH